MSSQFTTHYPAETLPRRVGAPGSAEQPVVLLAFAKLVVMAAAMVLFTPFWLEQVADFATGPGPQSWLALRFAAFGGVAALLVLAVMILKVWTGLLKHLARLD
jgi:hypothetical protein